MGRWGRLVMWIIPRPPNHKVKVEGKVGSEGFTNASSLSVCTSRGRPHTQKARRNTSWFSARVKRRFPVGVVVRQARLMIRLLTLCLSGDSLP